MCHAVSGLIGVIQLRLLTCQLFTSSLLESNDTARAKMNLMGFMPL